MKAVRCPGKPKFGEVWQQQQADLSQRLYVVVSKHFHTQEFPPTEPPTVHEQHVVARPRVG